MIYHKKNILDELSLKNLLRNYSLVDLVSVWWETLFQQGKEFRGNNIHNNKSSLNS